MQKMTAAQRDALQRSINLLIYDDATDQLYAVDLRDAPPLPADALKWARRPGKLPCHPVTGIG